MNVFYNIIIALWNQDFDKLSKPHLVWIIYLFIFVILFSENSILPATFLPEDSLLILLGILTAKVTLNFPFSILIFTVASFLGSWIGYLQGRWLKNLPKYYHQKTYTMFNKYGFYALLIGRFIGFIRTLLPIITGLSGLNIYKFYFFNFISALL